SYFSNMADRDNLLSVSWHDSAWIPMLNAQNVMDYFSERSNSFYDRTCNNEIIKMQRLNPEQLNNMTGVEYILLHVQEPILYIVRKQHRHSPNQVTALTDYYIIAGVVYQAPDLGSVVSSRLLNATFNLQSSFEEAQSYSRYHPSKGYWFEFKDKDQAESSKKDGKKKKEEPSSIFQRQRVDVLLTDLANKFPPKQPPPPAPVEKQEDVKAEKPATIPNIKREKPDDTQGQNKVNGNRQPPEKKPKLMR
ncbi:unnamed protein product, partial [Owenia fusiformis]